VSSSNNGATLDEAGDASTESASDAAIRALTRPIFLASKTLSQPTRRRIIIRSTARSTLPRREWRRGSAAHCIRLGRCGHAQLSAGTMKASDSNVRPAVPGSLPGVASQYRKMPILEDRQSTGTH
jgi:hypothetical protein